MDVKAVLLCIESAIIVLFLIGFVVAGEMAAKWHRSCKDLTYKLNNVTMVNNQGGGDGANKNAPAEPEGYERGKDRFLDNLSHDERAEFYKVFIFNSCCGLKYKPCADNAEFFSGVFIKLSGVRFAISDGLMYKICMEYDRLRGMPVSAENK